MQINNNSINPSFYQNENTQVNTNPSATNSNSTPSISADQAKAIAISFSKINPAELAGQLSSNGLTLSKTLSLIS